MIRRLFILGFLCISTASALAQVEPDAYGGTPRVTVGGTLSFFNADYASNHMTGPSAYFDWSPPMFWHLGAEAEGRWLTLGGPHSFSEYNYLAGPRYLFPVGKRVRPYAKFLLGAGEVNFQYQLGHGGYFAMAPGGGIDFTVQQRWRLRADYEFQIWPNAVGIPGIPSSALKPNGVTVGFSYQIF
ncbi:MAG: outer membrane beta-barrel protein [Terracidiphilus sp.]